MWLPRDSQQPSAQNGTQWVVDTFPTRKLSGLQVSTLGFGGSPLGGIFTDVDEEKAVESVHEAFRMGINFFDTSPYYGTELFRAEKVLGRALLGLPREQIVVSTKVGRYGHFIPDFDFSAAKVTESVHQSLLRLGTAYIDFILCHDIEYGDLDQVVNEAIPALNALRAQGLVRRVGITGLPLSAFQYVLDRVKQGCVDVVLTYCHYTLHDTTLASFMPYLRERGVDVISAAPLSMALLTQQGPPSWHPAPPQLKEAARAATELAAARGFDIANLALKFAMRYGEVSSMLVGMCTPEQVRSNVAVARQALGIDDTPNAAEEAVVMQEVLRIFASVKDMSWSSGRISWPEGIAAGSAVPHKWRPSSGTL